MKFRIITFLLFVSLPTCAQDGLKSFGSIKNRDDLARFAIIGDLTGGERSGVFKVAAEGIKAMQPDFILSIGDLIEGGIEDVDVLNKEWSTFRTNLDNDNLVFFPTVGNHDISNMVMRDWYTKTVGPRYYHFKYKNMLFLILDSEDFTLEFFTKLKKLRNDAIEVYKKNPEEFIKTPYAKMPQRKYGEMSKKQSNYFVEIINANKDVIWTYILMHKPLWQNDKEKEFKKLEKALKGRKYTVFNGHVHTYEYTQRFGHDYIQLATSGGEQTVKEGNNMDHILWVSADKEGPQYLNIKLDGMRDKQGQIPANGNSLCFDTYECKN